MKKYPTPSEIAGMRASGYERRTIQEAEARASRWPAAQELCDQITAVFAGVTLGSGVGLHQGLGLDDYADDATLASYRAGDEKDDWSRINADALTACHSSLSFFDAEGMRFHLPAFLIAELKGEYGMDLVFALAYLSDHNISQFTLLSPEQRSAVRAYLLHIQDDEEYAWHRDHIVRALEEYWIAQA